MTAMMKPRARDSKMFRASFPEEPGGLSRGNPTTARWILQTLAALQNVKNRHLRVVAIKTGSMYAGA